jgi:membrane protein involved in colicin uptake
LQFKRNAVERLEERKQVNLGRIAELEKEIAAKPVGSGEIPRLQRRIAFYQEMIAKIDVEILESRVELEAAEQKEAAKKNEEEKAIKAEKEKAAQRAIEKAAKEAAEAAKKEAAQRAAAEKRAARSATSAMNSPRLTSLDYIFQLASSSPSSSA